MPPRKRKADNDVDAKHTTAKKKQKTTESKAGLGAATGAAAGAIPSSSPLKLVIQKRKGWKYKSDSSGERVVCDVLRQMGLIKHAVQNRFFSSLKCAHPKCQCG